MRLRPNLQFAAVSTVLFGLFVFALKLDGGVLPVSRWMLLGMLIFRALHSAVTLWLYMRGGAWLVWLFATLLLSRLWFEF